MFPYLSPKNKHMISTQSQAEAHIYLFKNSSVFHQRNVQINKLFLLLLFLFLHACMLMTKFSSFVIISKTTDVFGSHENNFLKLSTIIMANRNFQHCQGYSSTLKKIGAHFVRLPNIFLFNVRIPEEQCPLSDITQLHCQLTSC